ncbi:mRNA-decapping enzyme 1B isoform 1-T1 [Discoglossus pictus]
MAASGIGPFGRGLDISLAALRQQDPYIQGIVDVASQVALYTFSQKTNEWEKTEVEGTLFVYTRSASPKHGFTIMNRLSMENRTEPITKDLDFQLQDPFLLYRNARFFIYGIWFYNKEECQRIAELMKNLTQEEQLKAHHGAAAGISPMTLTSAEGKDVDILQMLTKAKDEYTKCKSCSEPKMITSSSAIYSNPNLIKPIAVKPSEKQQQKPDVGDPEPQHLSLTTLFGKPDKAQGEATRHPPSAHHTVIRSLSYEDPRRTSENFEKQLCPAIQKLMVHGAGLHPVSELPESRQCLNGTFHPAGEIFAGLLQPVLNPSSFFVQNKEGGENLLIKLHTSQTAVSKTDTTTTSTCHGFSGVISTATGKGQAPFSYYESSMQSQITPASMPPLPLSSQTPTASGAISPQELLKKLQLVRQEQQLHSNHKPALAAKFPVVSQSGSSAPWGAKIPVGENLNPLLQVISPQTIPATVPPALLMSPMVFTQSSHKTRPSDTASLTFSTKESSAGVGGLLLPPTLTDTLVCNSNTSIQSSILTKAQLQETLLHLIQNDNNFLNTIYETYLSVLGKGNTSGRKI